MNCREILIRSSTAWSISQDDYKTNSLNGRNEPDRTIESDNLCYKEYETGIIKSKNFKKGC